MLPLLIKTSYSDMIPISDFHYLCELARCSRCQLFILYNNVLYGASDDCCSIHEINVPFQTNTDLVFRLDMTDKDILAKYKNFFIPSKFDYALVPDYYWDMYIHGDIEEIYDQMTDRMVLIDRTTKQPIEQFFLGKCRIQNDFMRINMMNQLEGFFNRKSTLLYPHIFYDLEKDPVIRKIYDNKASIGRALVHLKNDLIDVTFYTYKGLFVLNKADSLAMEIRIDSIMPGTFMGTFLPKRKKNPMNLNTYNEPFSEKIHCMYLNIAM